MNTLQIHDVGQLSWHHHVEELYVPLEGFCSMIGSLQSPTADPNLLHLIYPTVQKACLPGHLPENRGEIIGPFLHKQASVGQVVGLLGYLYNLGILREGLPTALLEEFYKGSSLFQISVGMFFLGGV